MTASDAQIPEPVESPARRSRWVNIGLAVFLGAECVYGVWYSADGWWDVVMWLTVMSVLIINTLRRSPVIDEDARWWVWIICTAATLRFLAFEYDEESQGAYWLLVFFNVIADTALIALGKSFSLLPARRQIRTAWLYRFVRHPAYSAYILIDAVYVSQMPTVQNFAVLFIGLGLFIGRAHLEEAVLSGAPAYREYMQRVRWRFVPGVY